MTYPMSVGGEEEEEAEDAGAGSEECGAEADEEGFEDEGWEEEERWAVLKEVEDEEGRLDDEGGGAESKVGTLRWR